MSNAEFQVLGKIFREYERIELSATGDTGITTKYFRFHLNQPNLWLVKLRTDAERWIKAIDHRDPDQAQAYRARLSELVSGLSADGPVTSGRLGTSGSEQIIIGYHTGT